MMEMFKKDTFGFKKTTTKIMYLSYCALGGIIKSPYVSSVIKYVWIAYNIVSFTLVHVCINDYLMVHRKLEILTALHSALIVMASSGTFFVYSVTFYFRDNLERVMHFLDSDDDIFSDKIKSKQKGDYDVKTILKYHSFSVLLNCIYFSLRPIRVLFQGQSVEALRSIYNYFYCFRWIYQVNTLNQYIIIYSVQLVTIAVLFFPLLVLSVFISSVVFELHNKFKKLKRRMDSRTNYHTKRIEMLHREQVDANSRNEIIKISNRIKIIDQEFSENMVKYVKCHQQLVASTNYFKTYVEIFFSLFLPFVTIIVTTEGILLLTSGEDKSTLLDFTILLVEVATGVLKYCDMGRLLEEMNQIITEEIYNTPWYNIPPSQRKTIYIFLCQAQNPVHFYALKVFPMLLPTFPGMLRVAFSIVQVVSKVRH